MPGGKPPGKQPRPEQEVELEKSGRVQVIMLRGVLFLPPAIFARKQFANFFSHEQVLLRDVTVHLMKQLCAPQLLLLPTHTVS